MRDCSHCKMNPDKMDYFEEFYDFSNENLAFLERKLKNLQVKPFSDIPQEGTESSTQKPDKIIEENEEEWEDCSDEEILEEKPVVKEEKLESVESTKKDEKFVLVDGYWRPLKQKLLTSKFQKNQISRNEKGEMVLPNGDIVGHRKYLKYYKQNMHDLVRRKNELIFALTNRAQKQSSEERQLANAGKMSTTLSR